VSWSSAANGRGEHMRIGTYVAQSVDSELSGNMNRPVPGRRAHLQAVPLQRAHLGTERRAGVSRHDCVGANLNVQVRRNKVMRVLPARERRRKRNLARRPRSLQLRSSK